MSAKIAFILLFFINSLIFINFKKISKIINIYDHPDEKRKFHEKATPILGGFIFYFSILFLFSIQNFSIVEFQDSYLFENKYFFIFLTIVFFFYLYDDIKILGPNLKLILQIFIILTYLILDQSLLINNLEFSFAKNKIFLGWFSIPFTVLCFMLFINAFNMFDGINLQCGLYTLQIFLVLFFITNNIIFIYLIIPITFFLILNYLNLCFLGNNGTSIISFSISVIIIKIYNTDALIYADDIFIIMCVPGFDLLRLAVKRIINKSHPFYPDRNHIHHVLLKKFNQNQTVYIIQVLIFIPIILNFFTSVSSILLISVTIITYFLLIFKT